ncbi:MAG: hypothetical protein ABT940_12790 [Alphaproteobacteria bacterium]
MSADALWNYGVLALAALGCGVYLFRGARRMFGRSGEGCCQCSGTGTCGKPSVGSRG